MGIQMSKLEDVRQPSQGTLFNGTPEGENRRQWLQSTEKLMAATASLDKLRRKYGRGTVVPATVLERQARIGRDGSDGQSGVAGRAPEREEGAAAPDSSARPSGTA